MILLQLHQKAEHSWTTVTWDARQETISISPDTETVVSQLLRPFELQKCSEKKDRGPVMASPSPKLKTMTY